MDKIAVLLLSYALVYLVQWYDPPFEQYYFLLAMSCFFICVACAYTKDLMCIGYGLIQAILMFFYICTILPTGFWTDWVLYCPKLNYSIVVYCYELAMIGAGLWNGLLLCGIRGYNANRRVNNSKKGIFEASTSV